MINALAWHFVGDRLRDGRPVPADGETLRHDGPLRLCESGPHASERLIDALKYAPGDTICRDRMSGEIVFGDDKMVAMERTIVWRVDGEKILRAFARRCALDVNDLWDAPEVVRRYLETGDETIRDAAQTAARETAESDDESVAESVAESAAWATVLAAARDVAARDAAYATAHAAAGAFVRTAVRPAARASVGRGALDKYNDWLTEMVMAEGGGQ